MSAHSHDAPATGHAHHEHHEHVTPLAHYFGVFGALMVLTVVTVWIAGFDFGVANTFIAMAVATLKASLVAAIFMHLLYDDRLNTLIFVFGLLFVALFFIFTLTDVLSRTYIDPMQETRGQERAQLEALRLEMEQAREPVTVPRRVDEAAVPADELPPAPVTDAAPATAAAPGTDAAAPGTDAAAPGTDAAAPGTDAAAPGTDAAAPGTNAAAPGTDAAAPGTDAAAPGTDAAPASAP